jgi:DNA-binding transcriptional LysR family regulator
MPAACITLPHFATSFFKSVSNTCTVDGAGSIAIATNRVRVSGTLERGELDFVISSTPAEREGLIEEIFHYEEFAVYASLNHRLARHKEVTFVQLSRERWALPHRTGGPFQRSIATELAARGFSSPTVAMISWEADVRARLIGVTDMLGYSSRRFAEEAALKYPIKVLRVKGYSWWRPCAVVYRKGGYLTPAARRLLEYVKIAAKEEGRR